MDKSTKNINNVAEVTETTENNTNELSTAVGMTLIRLICAGSMLNFLYVSELDGVAFWQRWIALVAMPASIVPVVFGGLCILQKIVSLIPKKIVTKAPVCTIVAYVILISATCGPVLDYVADWLALTEKSLNTGMLCALSMVVLYFTRDPRMIISKADRLLDTISPS